MQLPRGSVLRLFRDLWEDETQREVIESLKADCEVRIGRPVGH
jgi:hypothetical protein